VLNGYTPHFTSFSGGVYESELVRSAIHARATHISKLKVEFSGAAKPALQNKLKHGPSQFQTWGQFLYRLSTILDVHNTAFITPVYDEFGEVSGVYCPLPSRCTIVQYNNVPYLRYEFSHGQHAAIELDYCGVMTKHQYKNDFFGDNNEALDETMKLISIQNKGLEEAVKNSATYRFIAQVNNFSKTDDLAKERKRFSEENLSKEAESGGILLFPNTYSNIKQIDAKPYTVDPEQRKLIENNVAEYFGVNEKVMRNEANGDELDAFFNGAIEPFAIQFSEAMTMAIFSERERAQGSYFIANANRLQYMSVTAKVQMAKELGDRGAILIDEIRDLFNYPPLPDGAGQVAPIRGEYKNTEDLGGDGNAVESQRT
jgi:hypothetical protein